MGKKKHKKKQKKAAQDEQAASSGPSPLHRIGQLLIDQARSPAGRQLMATGLIVAASALARETARAPSDEAPRPASEPPAMDTGEAPKQAPSTGTGFPDTAALVGTALTMLDQFLHRQPPSDRK